MRVHLFATILILPNVSVNSRPPSYHPYIDHCTVPAGLLIIPLPYDTSVVWPILKCILRFSQISNLLELYRKKFVRVYTKNPLIEIRHVPYNYNTITICACNVNISICIFN